MRFQSQLWFSVAVWKNGPDAAIVFHITAETRFDQLKNRSNAAVSSRNDHILNSWATPLNYPKFCENVCVHACVRDLLFPNIHSSVGGNDNQLIGQILQPTF